MLNKNQMTFIHALVVLPDKRILLRKRYYDDRSTSKWAATIEGAIFETDVPSKEVVRTVSDGLKLDLKLFYNNQDPEATIQQLGRIRLPEYNRVIYPFVVKVKKVVTLKSDPRYQFVAKPFEELTEEIMSQTVYCPNLSEKKHTVNTVHVLKEVHLKDVLVYVSRG